VYASQHILSQSASPEIERVAAGRASSIKIPRVHAMAGLTLAVICVAAADLLVVIQ